MGEVILTMKGIDKSFPGVHALDHVDLEVRKGEVLALMGENGAGKSTLMKVLTGIYKKDSGTITYEGKEVEFANTREAQDNGIVIVHQELNMLGHLTVAQNIFIGREFKKGIRIDDKKMNEEAKKLFDRMHIDIDPRETMNKLTVGKQQMCEIAKAISHDAKVIIFDEPSAALTETEIQEMFKIINDLKAKGIGIIYISHRMDEIKVITDRVTVMRDGTYVGTLVTSCQCDSVRSFIDRIVQHVYLVSDIRLSVWSCCVTFYTKLFCCCIDTLFRCLPVCRLEALYNNFEVISAALSRILASIIRCLSVVSSAATSC